MASDPTDMHMAPQNAGEGGASLSNDPPDAEAGNGNASPSAVQQNNPPHQTGSAESAAEDAVGVASVSSDPTDDGAGNGNAPPSAVQHNDPQVPTDSTNSAGEEAGVAANTHVGNAATVLASMFQKTPPAPPFIMPKTANEVSLDQARALMKVAKLNEKARKKREREEDAGLFTDVDELKKKLKVAKEEAQRLKMEKQNLA